MDTARAASILRAGGLVAFPTETVYGLGADATSPRAVARIFEVKGRPATNPIIVHVADEDAARRSASSWPDAAARLATKFWPGPLTLVVLRGVDLAPAVCARGPTVGLRAPDHPVALALLRAFGGPVAAPSANRSTRTSPTTAEHVRADLADSVDLVLDGGACRVGIESTVVDLAGESPTILRPGAVSREAIEAVIGPVAVARGAADLAAPLRSPGLSDLHYAPRARALRFDPGERASVAAACARQATGTFAIVLVGDPGPLRGLAGVVELPADPAGYAARLYAALREADAPGVSTIWIELPPEQPRWVAVRDRLLRATRTAGA